jgi:hypothetical protein
VAVFHHDFADGIGDWTEVELTSGHSTPVWTAPVSTDQLRATSTSSHNEALVWNDIDSDADRDDFDILCQVYVDSTTATQRYLGGRISTSGTRNGYALRVRTNSIDTYRFNGSTYTAIENGTFSVASGTWVWIRFRMVGTTIQAKGWTGAEGDEPGTWICSQTDATYSTAGHVGCIKGANTNTQLWRYFNVGTNGDTATMPTAGGTDLTVSDASHGHTADSLTLSIGVSLAINDATHGHAADSLTLSTTGSTSLTVADATHAHTADAPALSVDSLLAVADALHAHSADNVVLGVSGAADLVIADATHAHSVDGLVLTAQSLLAIQDALHAHAADELTLDSAPTLLIAEALHAHTSDGLALTVDAWLAVADATHAHSAGAVVLTISGGDLDASPGYTITGRRRAFEIRGRTRRFEVDQ